jgi:hypothetical protein
LEESEILKELSLIKYQQRLIVEMLKKSDEEFYKLIIKYELEEREVQEIYHLFDQLNLELEEQKAEGFVYFHPLYKQFSQHLNKKIAPVEVIHACLKQDIHVTLMKELEKYV